MALWEKAGKAPVIGEVRVLFRDTNDYGNPEISVSQNWHVWRINEEFRRVGKLEGDNQKAEIGLVIAPDSIVHRMRTGEYDFSYKAY